MKGEMMDDKSKKAMRQAAEVVLTDFLIENDVYEHFLYGLKYCSIREGTFTTVKDFIDNLTNYRSAISSAFTWKTYTRSRYGKKNPVHWERLSTIFAKEFDKRVEEAVPRTHIIKALDVIN